MGKYRIYTTNLSEYIRRPQITPEREVENNNIEWKKALSPQALMCITPHRYSHLWKKYELKTVGAPP
jgi:hypothetical protein